MRLPYSIRRALLWPGGEQRPAGRDLGGETLRGLWREYAAPPAAESDRGRAADPIYGAALRLATRRWPA